MKDNGLKNKNPRRYAEGLERLDMERFYSAAITVA